MSAKITLLMLFVAAMLLMSWRYDKKKKVLFFGDSITEMGVRPGGYINEIEKLMAAQPNNPYEVIGSGIGGNKIYDLYLRLDDDVLAKNPSLVVMYIGVNDVWHKKTGGTGTDADKFEKFYKAIIHKLTAANIKIIMCTPAVVGERKDNSNELNGDLNYYSNIIRKIAKESSIPLVDLRSNFLTYLSANNPENKWKDILTYDGVHLNDTGNQLVAKLIWNQIQAIKY